MSTLNPYSVAADSILVVHVLFVVFVVMGLILIFVGKFLQWHWVRNRRFRIAHLLSIGIVVLQAWLGVICPLTTLEMKLREKAGEAVYTESFIQHWFQEILYYDAPLWVFTVCYTLFASLVVGSWFWVRPRSNI